MNLLLVLIVISPIPISTVSIVTVSIITVSIITVPILFIAATLSVTTRKGARITARALLWPHLATASAVPVVSPVAVFSAQATTITRSLISLSDTATFWSAISWNTDLEGANSGATEFEVSHREFAVGFESFDPATLSIWAVISWMEIPITIVVSAMFFTIFITAIVVSAMFFTIFVTAILITAMFSTIFVTAIVVTAMFPTIFVMAIVVTAMFSTIFVTAIVVTAMFFTILVTAIVVSAMFFAIIVVSLVATIHLPMSLIEFLMDLVHLLF